MYSVKTVPVVFLVTSLTLPKILGHSLHFFLRRRARLGARSKNLGSAIQSIFVP